MRKFIGLSEAVGKIKDGMTIMIGGFLANGTPEKIIDEIVRQNLKGLTIICNDTGYTDRGIGKLIVNNIAKKVYASHIGTNKVTGEKMKSGEIEVVLTPQGTLIEQIRAGGFGLGGVLTRTGLGTAVEEGKQKIIIDGQEYIIEKPLHADFALIYGDVVDELGNIQYQGTTRNFNIMMAYAADTVIVEAAKKVTIGSIDQNNVNISGILIDYIINEEEIL